MFKDKKAVIFDMDGTLIDSVWLWDQIDTEFLYKYNIPLPEDLREKLEGMNFDIAAEYFKKRFNLAMSVESIKDEWNSMAEDHYRYKIMLKPNVKEFIAALKLKNFKLAIATSNTRKLSELVLKRNGILDYFEDIVTSGELKAEKPKPDVYLKAAELLNTNPEDCIAFEDTYSGVMAAKNANMYVVAVNDKYACNSDKIKKYADKYINNFNEIIDCI